MTTITLAQAISNNITRLNSEFEHVIENAQDALSHLAKDFLPSGSGFDAGCEIDVDASRTNKLVIRTQFHHMNENGFYDGWTRHKVVVTPTFGGIDVTVSGINRDGIHEYIGDTIYDAMGTRLEVKLDHDSSSLTYTRAE